MIRVLIEGNPTAWMDVDETLATEQIIEMICSKFNLPNTIYGCFFFTRSSAGLCHVNNLLLAKSNGHHSVEFHCGSHKILCVGPVLIALPRNCTKEQASKIVSSFFQIPNGAIKIFDANNEKFEYSLDMLEIIPDGASVWIELFSNTPIPSESDDFAYAQKISEEQKFEEENVPEFLCLLCRDTFSREKIFFSDCGQHFTCFECTLNSFRHHIISEDVIPTCPLANGQDGCNFIYPYDSLMEFFSCIKSSGTATIENEADWNFEFHPKNQTYTSSKIERVYNRRRLAIMGLVHCANPNCKNGVLPPEDFIEGINRLAQCDSCGTEFCLNCRTSPYHYNCFCDEVSTYQREWLEWIRSGRLQYIESLQNQNSKYEQLLDQYNKKRTEYENDAKAAAEALTRLEQDEQYKSSRCKQCPKCSRIIEKISGCDSMKCGDDYHGNNKQGGCGATFKWSTAPVYVPQVDRNERRVNQFAEKPPDEIQQVCHMVVDNIPYQCEVCDQAIQGPRLCCINCVSSDVCLQCQDAATNLPHSKHKGHIFLIYTENENINFNNYNK